jgi:LacI family gluconate utilization system Gnt-I transcriptional repressor
LVLEVLASRPDLDGIVCNSDIIAMGALRGLARTGRKVPDEIGVVGFGDNEAAACLTPTLTSVRPPRAELGRAIAAALLDRIDGQPPVSRRFAAGIVARGSTDRTSRP